ncbi:hypothetical protein ABPG74_013901 [Tetrahymena malaccensis]
MIIKTILKLDSLETSNLTSVNFDLSQCKQQIIEQPEIEKICKFVQRNANIQNISFKFNQINEVGLYYLFSIFNKMIIVENLVSLNFDLSTFKIKDQGLSIFCQGIKNCVQLQQLSLNLYYTEVQSEGIQILCQTLKRFLFLTSLDINIGGNIIDNETIKHMGLMVSSLSDLNNLTLCFSSNQLDIKGLIILTEQISVCQELEQLYLSFKENQFGDEGLTNFGNLISRSIKLKKLSLQLENTNVGDIGLQQLCFGLNKIKTFQSLELAISLNGQIGLQNMPVEAYKYLTSLTVQHIEKQVDQKFLKLMHDNLKNYQNLSALKMFMSKLYIDVNGVSKLSEGISSCQNLKTLYIQSNFSSIKKSGALKLSQEISKCKNLKELFISLKYCDIGDFVENGLYKAIAHLPHLLSLIILSQGDIENIKRKYLKQKRLVRFIFLK